MIFNKINYCPIIAKIADYAYLLMKLKCFCFLPQKSVLRKFIIKQCVHKVDFNSEYNMSIYRGIVYEINL